jgi:hypothetical protein
MSLGPVEILVLKFPGNQFKGEIAPALADLIDSGTIRVLDLLFVLKDEEGNVQAVELGELPDELYAQYNPVVEEFDGMFSPEDIEYYGGLLEPNSSGAMMLFENTWATRFRDAVVNANGEVVLNARIPKAAIDEILEGTPA